MLSSPLEADDSNSRTINQRDKPSDTSLDNLIKLEPAEEPTLEQITQADHVQSSRARSVKEESPEQNQSAMIPPQFPQVSKEVARELHWLTFKDRMDRICAAHGYGRQPAQELSQCKDGSRLTEKINQLERDLAQLQTVHNSTERELALLQMANESAERELTQLRAREHLYNEGD